MKLLPEDLAIGFLTVAFVVIILGTLYVQVK